MADTMVNIRFNDSESRVEAIECSTKRLYKSSTCLGELKDYKDEIEELLGGFENIPANRADKLFEFISKIEHYGNAAILMLLSKHIKDNNSIECDEVLCLMLKELTDAWFTVRHPKFGQLGVKVYLVGKLLLTLVLNTNNKI